MAQVVSVAGADKEKEWGPAPLEDMEARFSAQVPIQKPHLRQRRKRPDSEMWREMRQGRVPSAVILWELAWFFDKKTLK